MQQTEDGEATRHSFLNMRPHHQIGVDMYSEVADG